MKKPSVGFIGLGSMGFAMCKRLVDAGFPVAAYNRTLSKAETLREFGAIPVTSPHQAARRADILITMVSDDQALESVMFGSNGALEGMRPQTIHISMSTISERLAERLTVEHLKTNTLHVGAPVFGRPPAAVAGKLFVMAAGAEGAVAQVQNIFEVLAQKITVVGTNPKEAHLTKILGNFMLFSAIETMAEAIAQAKKSGLGDRTFLEAMTSTIFSAPFYANYGAMMVDQNFPTTLAVSFGLALKDIRLALESSETQNAEMPVARLIESRLLEGIAGGYESYDVSALVRLATGLKMKS